MLQRACPAGVYEYVDVEKGQESPEAYNGKKLVINSQVSAVRVRFTPYLLLT